MGLKVGDFININHLREALKDANPTNISTRNKFILNITELSQKELNLVTEIQQSINKSPDSFTKEEIKSIKHYVKAISRLVKDIDANKKAIMHLEARVLDIRETEHFRNTGTISDSIKKDLNNQEAFWKKVWEMGSAGKK